MAECLVLGAGIAGIGAALALQARGHQVRVLDRKAPGSETSGGNAGVIQNEARLPYAIPRAPLQLLGYGLGLSNDVRVGWPRIFGQIGALARYYHQSAPARHAAIGRAYAPLIARATADHGALIAAAGAEGLIRKTGLGEIYSSQRGLDAAAQAAGDMARAHGLALRVVSGGDLRAEEPVLTATPAGAVIWDESWSCTDPAALVRAYAALFVARGGEIARAELTGLAPSGQGWQVATDQGPEQAAHIVLALGPWTPGFLRPLGTRLAMIAKRGYHGHFALNGQLTRPYVLADDGVVIASMTAGLRITTGAHVTALGGPPNLAQLRRGRAAAAALLALGDPVPDSEWSGTRPCLPDMLPLVGALPGAPGLWLNFGHGHQGFTLGPTTGALLAAAIDGAPDPLAAPLAPETRLPLRR